MSEKIPRRKISDVKIPSATILLGENTNDWRSCDHEPVWGDNVAWTRHGIGANYLFHDAHVKFMTKEDTYAN